MFKKFVIKDTENNKYFTGNYNCWWSLDIKDAKQFRFIEALERELAEQTNIENDFAAFEKVNTIIVETIYHK